MAPPPPPLLVRRRTTLATETDSAVDSEQSFGGLVQDCLEEEQERRDNDELVMGNKLGKDDSDSDDTQAPVASVKEALSIAMDAGFKGGIAGAAAMGVNVFALMWIRTTVS
jgi:hypothetical protein